MNHAITIIIEKFYDENANAINKFLPMARVSLPIDGLKNEEVLALKATLHELDYNISDETNKMIIVSGPTIKLQAIELRELYLKKLKQ